MILPPGCGSEAVKESIKVEGRLVRAPQPAGADRPYNDVMRRLAALLLLLIAAAAFGAENGKTIDSRQARSTTRPEARPREGAVRRRCS